MSHVSISTERDDVQDKKKQGSAGTVRGIQAEQHISDHPYGQVGVTGFGGGTGDSPERDDRADRAGLAASESRYRIIGGIARQLLKLNQEQLGNLSEQIAVLDSALGVLRDSHATTERTVQSLEAVLKGMEEPQ